MFFNTFVFEKLLQEGTIAICVSQLLYGCSGCSMLNELCNQNASLNTDTYI